MKCQHCNKRIATVNWVGEGSMLDFVHGNYQRWCERCCAWERFKWGLKFTTHFAGCFIIFLFLTVIVLLGFLGFSNGG